MEESHGKNKVKPKLEIPDLLKKHFTNGIWKVNPYLRFRYLASFCNVHTSAISKDDKVCTISMFQRCYRPYYKKTHHKATDEEAKHMVNVLDKAIKNPDQVQAVSAADKMKLRHGKLMSCFVSTFICGNCFTNFLVIFYSTLAQKIIHILSPLHSGHTTEIALTHFTFLISRVQIMLQIERISQTCSIPQVFLDPETQVPKGWFTS